MRKDVLEAWEIFMKLCEEFPELYDRYVEKVESEMRSYKPDLKITAAAKERCQKKLLEERDSVIAL